MKKMLGMIIVLLVIIIIVISIAFYTYVNKENSQKPIEPDNGEEPFMLDGPGYEYVPEFLGHTLEEIQEIIEQYYGNYYGMYNVSVECYYDENDVLRATVSTEYEETGDAVNVDTGEMVYFFGTETQAQRIQSNVEFNDNEYIAIGYVTDLDEEKFVDKYFPDGAYGQLLYFDFRIPENQRPDYGNKFVIVPKNGDVTITVYDCYMGEDGEIYTDNTLIQSISEPFILLDDYIEYIPKICIKFECNGFEEMFPINFSGRDGTLYLDGYEMEVKDISLY